MCQNIDLSLRSLFVSQIPLNWRVQSNHICKNHAYTTSPMNSTETSPLPSLLHFTDWKDEPAERLKYRNGNIKWNQSDGFRIVLLFVVALSLRNYFVFGAFRIQICQWFTFERFSSFCYIAERVFSMDIHYKQIKKKTHHPPWTQASIILIVNRKSNQM